MAANLFELILQVFSGILAHYGATGFFKQAF